MLEIPLSTLGLLANILTGLVATNYAMATEPWESRKELYCLAINSYWEARGEGFDDKIATAQVVMNRVQSTRYPDDVCAVVTQGPVREVWSTRKDPSLAPSERRYFPIRNRCQFSWYCDGKNDRVTSRQGWEDSVIAAYLVYNGYGEDKVDGATHYCAYKQVTPRWASKMVVTAKLEGHAYLK